MDHKLLMELITVPLFTGVIGYITNWSGVLMLFAPLKFHGFKVPGLKFMYPFLPRRVQVIPALQSGGRFGWQGIVPSRAAKMASIAVDKSLAKVGSIKDFYLVLEPESIAEHLVKIAKSEFRETTARIMLREDPALWHNLPDFVKEGVYRRVEGELPAIVKVMTDEIGENIEEFVDAKLMVIRYLSDNPKLLNDIFRNMGSKELKFMQNFGFYFGYPMGFVLVGILYFLPYWWVLPVGGVIIGYVVNYVGITMIFEPVHPNKWVPWRQGLFLKRKPEIVLEYAKTLADEVITLQNISEELLHGPRSDRSRAMFETVIRPAVDRAAGPARAAVRIAVGTKEYDRMRNSVAGEALEYAPLLYADEEFNRAQAAKIFKFVAAQMDKLSLDDFNELLRSAVKQDEWLLFVHGAVLGAGAGLLHLAIFGV